MTAYGPQLISQGFWQEEEQEEEDEEEEEEDEEEVKEQEGKGKKSQILSEKMLDLLWKPTVDAKKSS